MTIKRLGEQGTKRVLQEIKGKANKTHTHTLDDVTETTSKKIMTSAEKTKLGKAITSEDFTTIKIVEADADISGLPPSTLVLRKK